MRLVFLHHLDRQHAQHTHLLHHHVDELGVDDVQLGDAALVDRFHVCLQQRTGDGIGDLDARLLGIAFPRLRQRTVAVMVVRHPATSIHVQLRLLTLAFQAGEQIFGLTND